MQTSWGKCRDSPRHGQFKGCQLKLGVINDVNWKIWYTVWMLHQWGWSTWRLLKEYQKEKQRHMYEAYVKSKFRYKIYLAMNDVTSVLYVSLVRQFETLLFYIVTSRIEALLYRITSFWMPVSKKSTACCCNQLFTVVSTSKMQIFSHNLGHSFPWHIREKFGQICDGEASVFADFRLNLLYKIRSHDAGATAAFVVVHLISTTFELPTPSSNHTVTHCSFSIDLTHLPVNIGWLDVLGLQKSYDCTDLTVSGIFNALCHTSTTPTWYCD